MSEIKFHFLFTNYMSVASVVRADFINKFIFVKMVRFRRKVSKIRELDGQFSERISKDLFSIKKIRTYNGNYTHIVYKKKNEI